MRDFPRAPVSTIEIIMMLLGTVAVVGGGILVLLAARGAPDGFEDREGFHVGSTSEPPIPEPVVPPGHDGM